MYCWGCGVKLYINGKIHDSKLFKKIFVQPASGDAGIAYGTAIVSFIKNTKLKKNFESRNFYLGSKFNPNEIKKSLLKYRKKIHFTFEKDIAKKAAKLISDGNILGWFQGAAEFGPRALGNRSIISKPFPFSMKNYVNKNVKFREPFRPFAPAVLENFAKDYFYLTQESQHMLIATKVKNNKKKFIPATVHVDNSCRAQTVNRNINTKFFDLINNFYKITKIPVVLNTSFNVKGQPIVNDPDDAILCFLKYKIDYLAIGDFLLKKK